MESDGTTGQTETLSNGGDGNPRRALVEWALVAGMITAEAGAMACFLARYASGH